MMNRASATIHKITTAASLPLGILSLGWTGLLIAVAIFLSFIFLVMCSCGIPLVEIAEMDNAPDERRQEIMDTILDTIWKYYIPWQIANIVQIAFFLTYL